MGQTRNRRKSALVFNEKYEGGASFWFQYFSGNCGLTSRQEMTDQTGNGWPKGSSSYDVGGPLFSETFDYEGWNLPALSLSAHNKSEWYKGFALPLTAWWDPSDPNQRWKWNPLPPLTNDLDLVSKGATAISRCAPTNPHASVANTIGELRRDGMPGLTGVDTLRKHGSPSSLGSEYLNVQFGWKPLVSDIRKLARAISDSKEIIDKYKRESGKVLHRSYRFPTTVDTEISDWTHGTFDFPRLSSYHYADWSGYSLYRTTTTKKVETWFEGAFTYQADVSDSAFGSVLEGAKQANHLLGILPTPSALYNLTPWTWALDWFTNTGDVVNNASMMITDGLVVVYGYIMEKTTITTVHEIDGPTYFDGSKNRSSVTTRYKRMRRIAASPFGFGLTFDGFSSSQLAIIAALGLTQGGRYAAK